MAILTKQAPFGHPPHSCIEISYRDEGNGGGAFYDHYTFQKTTKRETRMSVPEGVTTSDLKSYVLTFPLTLPLGTTTDEGKKIPPTVEQADRLGLLVITGHARETEKKRAAALALRDAHERQLLQRAVNQGRPILGICAGSWQIWSFLGGTLKDVTDHAWERMPSIGVTGKIGYNTQMHRVAISATSMLAGAITDGRRYAPSSTHAIQIAIQKENPLNAPQKTLKNLTAIHPAVALTSNSVHWKAPDATTLPFMGTNQPKPIIVATAQQDDAVAPQHKEPGAGAFKHPEAGTVEAFEQDFGAPILGILWHPEAYNNDRSISSGQHRAILTYMAKAGDAFCAKQKMIASLEAEYESLVSQFGEMNLGKRAEKRAPAVPAASTKKM